jgi:sugar phosphate isomerase/epimerase
MDRRNFVLGGISAFAALGFGASAHARIRQGFFRRIGRPIGLQLYTLSGSGGAIDIDEAFAQIAEAGYGELELPNLLGRKPVELRASADKAGLRLTSIHLLPPGLAPPSSTSLSSEPQKLVDMLGTLGATAAVMPIMPLPPGARPEKGEGFTAMLSRVMAQAGSDPWERMADDFNRIGSGLLPFGISLGYHNHNVEFAPVGKTTGWDILVAKTDPRLVSFEVDLGWVAAAGLDPADFLRKHRGRVRWVHVKDVMASTIPNFAFKMDPANVGAGAIRWAEVLRAAEAAGVTHYYVEQEAPFPGTRIDSVRAAYSFLSRLKA